MPHLHAAAKACVPGSKTRNTSLPAASGGVQRPVLHRDPYYSVLLCTALYCSVLLRTAPGYSGLLRSTLAYSGLLCRDSMYPANSIYSGLLRILAPPPAASRAGAQSAQR
eukprot:gene9617-biopygen3231